MSNSKSPLCRRFFHFYGQNFNIGIVALSVMNYPEFRKQFVRVWRVAGAYFQSIEVFLVLLMAVVMVAGVWLAFMGDLRSLASFALVIGYFTIRPVLHVKGILKWPFL